MTSPHLFSRHRRLHSFLTLVVTAGAGVALSLPTLAQTTSPVLLAQDSPIRSNIRIPPSDPQSTGDASDSQGEVTGELRFTCEIVEGEYTVMYYPKGRNAEGYPWATPTQLGGGWTPEARCNEISRRLESYRPDGLLELGTSVENGYDVICVTTQDVSSCRIVLTVPPGQDAKITRDRVFDNIVAADSGRQTDAVNALVGDNGSNILGQIEDALGGNISLPGQVGQPARSSSDWIDLRPFLAPDDGGFGTQLRPSNSNSPSPRLNPDNFR
jgi:hypothetical protein